MAITDRLLGAFLKTCRLQRLVFLTRCSTANWWERSPNYNNSNNFCYVTANGNANNNNARNSYGVAPDSAIPKGK